MSGSTNTSGDATKRLPGESYAAYKTRLHAAFLQKERSDWQKVDEEKEKQRQESMAGSTNPGAQPGKQVDVVMRDSRPGDLTPQEESPEDLLSRFQSNKKVSSGSGNGKASTTTAYKVLGDLQDTPTARTLLKANPDLNRRQVEHLRHVLVRHPETRTDLKLLSRRLEEEERSSTSRRASSSDKTSESSTPSGSRRPSVSDKIQQTTTTKGPGAKPVKKTVGGMLANSASNGAAPKRKTSLGAQAMPVANGKRASDTNPSLASSSKVDLSVIGKIPKKHSVASPQSPDRANSAGLSEDGIKTGEEERPPRWYQNLSRPTKRNSSESDVLTLLQRLGSTIDKRDVNVVRETLHKLPFQQVNGPLLKGTSMLSDGRGLPQLFDSGSMDGEMWPYDIQADAQELYNKWCRKIFDTDLLRGIELRAKANKEHGDRSNDRIIKGWYGKIDFRAFGHNELSNGQWFPTQLTTVRDGAHGASQGGICGKTGEGAYSCIMTGHSGYPDENRGDEVLYCGTDSDNGSPTPNTQLLLDNITSGKPVRFIRKSTLSSQWAPDVGYRYDGLYDVKDYEKLAVKGEPKAARHRFRLVRRPGQDPIRGGSGPEARPTAEEVERFKMDRRFR